MIDTIICGDALEELKKLPDESINCIVTSPPYWALRDYGTDGQIGLEKTFAEYLDKLFLIFDECKRVLRKDGTCFVNLGDSYGGSGCGTNDYRTEASKSIQGIGKNAMLYKTGGIAQKIDYPAKSLCLIPFRFAIGMVDRGWILRNTIIWKKNNCMPSSVKDRFTVDFEYVFFFVKNKKYWFEQQFENYKTFENRPNGVVRNREYSYQGKYKIMPPIGGIKQTEGNNNPTYSGNMPDWKQGRNKRCVWNIKYQDTLQEALYRQGMNKERGNNLIEKRDLPPQKDFVDKLRASFTIDALVEKTQLPRTHIEHWFRYDESGFAYPSKDDWLKVETDLFPELLKVYYEPDEIKSDVNGRNKRCVWTINTKPFKEAHFAVFPEALVEPMIRSGCPELVCKKCGKAREKITKRSYPNARFRIDTNCKERNIGQQQDRPSRLYSGRGGCGKPEPQIDFLGYTDCGCNAGWDSGIVLDCFSGAGTSCLVAKKLNRNFIGIDNNKEYCEMSEKRINAVKDKLI